MIARTVGVSVGSPVSEIRGEEREGDPRGGRTVTLHKHEGEKWK